MDLTTRRPRLLGLVAVGAVVLLLIASFKIDALSGLLSRGGTGYSAAFKDAAGIAPGDPVRVAGVVVGKVDAVQVSGDHAIVALTVDRPVHLGDRSTAALSLDTLLGQHSLVLASAGSGQLASGSTIPLARTTTPFGVEQALLGTAQALRPIDTRALGRALNTVASALDPAAPQVRSAATGLASISRAVSTREQQVQQLFAATARISTTLAGRSSQIAELLSNSGAILQTLDRRSAVIRELLRDTARFGAVVTRVIRENEGRVTPALAHLRKVLTVLRSHRGDLDQSLRLLAPFLRYFTNVSGTGRYFDSTISGILPVDLSGAGQ